VALSAGSTLLLVLAGVAAGLIGTAGGITSLISYPALLAVGVPPLPANVANLVAVVVCWPSSALASRLELRATSTLLASALPVAAAAGAAGSVLLLVTPPRVFVHVVPWLVLTGAVALVAQPALTARRATSGNRPAPRLLLGWVAALSIYGGYFGAGSGTMLLATLLILHEPRLPRANAIKNMVVGCAAVASAIVFVLAGPVRWAAVAPLAGGLVVGSFLGPRAARRLPSRVVRYVAATLAVALAVELWIHPH
jgi:uncharacterized membrane protein YfcA